MGRKRGHKELGESSIDHHLCWLGLASGAWAADHEQECMVAAFTDYNRANMALLTKPDPLMTVETAVSQRRLQEQYCLRIAKCHLAGLPPQNTTIALDIAFSGCL